MSDNDRSDVCEKCGTQTIRFFLLVMDDINHNMQINYKKKFYLCESCKTLVKEFIMGEKIDEENK